MQIILLVALVYAGAHMFRHLRDSVRASREQRVGQLVKQHEERYGTAATPAHRRFMAARHDTGWWTREVLHGFPVARTGYYSGWLAHRTAAEQERARRAEAARTHEEVRESFRSAAARRASANAEEIDRATGKPAASREEVRQAAKVLPFTPRQDAPGAPEAAPEAEAAQRPAPRPEPGPYATRRPDGKPETEADARFFDERDSGYAGPLNQDGKRLDPASPDDARAADVLGSLRRDASVQHIAGRRQYVAAGLMRRPLRALCGESLEGGPDPSPDAPICPACLELNRKAGYPAPDPSARDSHPNPPDEGETMPATTTAPETTYDDIQRSLKAEIRELHDEIARLRAKRAAWQLADALTGTLRDASTLGAFADYDDALDEQIKAVQRQLDAAESASGTLERNHGGMNEAHQSAPVPGADPRFYEG